MSDFSAFIQAVGFPIVACFFMYKQAFKSIEAVGALETAIAKLSEKIDCLIQGGHSENGH